MVRHRAGGDDVGPKTDRPSSYGATTTMTPVYAILGILLVILAIPLGLMLAPLIIGAILLTAGIRRSHRAIQPSLVGGGVAAAGAAR